MEDLTCFLDSITLPYLNESDRERLNAPFSLEEFQIALDSDGVTGPKI